MASSAKKKPALADRILGLIEGLAADDSCIEEELEFFAHRIGALEERLVLFDGEHGARGAARRASEKLAADRCARGLDTRNVGVNDEGRLQFPVGARKAP